MKAAIALTLVDQRARASGIKFKQLAQRHRLSHLQIVRGDHPKPCSSRQRLVQGTAQQHQPALANKGDTQLDAATLATTGDGVQQMWQQGIVELRIPRLSPADEHGCTHDPTLRTMALSQHSCSRPGRRSAVCQISTSLSGNGVIRACSPASSNWVKARPSRSVSSTPYLNEQ